MINILKKFKILFIIITLVMPFFPAIALTNLSEDDKILQKTELFITPRVAQFLVGSTFEVPIYIDTKGNNVNTINLNLRFDPKKLGIVNPSGGKSIFGIWVETPHYDNVKGTAGFSGIIPDGIVTSSGLIATITFKALTSGVTNIEVLPTSSVLLNDGLGTEIPTLIGRATYTLNPVPPDSVVISSTTHPSEDRWYNNRNPVLNWDPVGGADGFSILLDSSPYTTPPSVVTTTNQYTSYKDISDGISYFHVRASSGDLWTGTSHFQVRVDTTAPLKFSPSASLLAEDSENGIKKYVIMFGTEDALSGIDHYEVGVVNKKSDKDVLPVFIQSESPYLVSVNKGDSVRVIIRAFDRAGNLREGSVNLYKDFTDIIFIIVALILGLLILLHYLFGHRVWQHLERAYIFFKNISKEDKQ